MNGCQNGDRKINLFIYFYHLIPSKASKAQGGYIEGKRMRRIYREVRTIKEQVSRIQNIANDIYSCFNNKSNLSDKVKSVSCSQK